VFDTPTPADPWADLPDSTDPLPDIVVSADGAHHCKACGDLMFLSHRERVPLHRSNESVFCPGSMDETLERTR